MPKPKERNPIGARTPKQTGPGRSTRKVSRGLMVRIFRAMEKNAKIADRVHGTVTREKEKK
jgi:hypothetical protein